MLDEQRGGTGGMSLVVHIVLVYLDVGLRVRLVCCCDDSVVKILCMGKMCRNLRNDW